VLLPLEKSHAGEDAPEFAVELVYIARGAAWNEKGQFKLALPALDLPISRTGMAVFHPPLFKVTAEPGTFHVETYADPTSAALNPPPPPMAGTRMVKIAPGQAADAAAPAAPVPGAAYSGSETKLTDKAPQGVLIDNLRLAGGRAAGILPIRVDFPELGPSLFLVSELTAENQAPTADFNFQREKKGSAQ
jgi:hypothetical protein